MASGIPSSRATTGADGGQQHFAQVGGGRDDVLAVVQDQQHLLAGERRGQRLGGRKALTPRCR
jgi:hypothetical protein